MRLARYILLELAVGGSLIAGGGAGIYYGGQELLKTSTAQAAGAQLGDFVDDARRAPVAEPRHPPARAFEPLERPPNPPPLAANGTYFLGFSDEVLLEPLRDRTLTKVKFNRGGSSVSMRLDFASGGRASFKPDQTNMQSIPRKEVAAYRISRMLGVSAVAPAIPGEFPREWLVAAMDQGTRGLLPRFNAEVPSNADGMVTGSLAWWIPAIVDCKLQGFRVDSTDGIVLWKRYLSVGVDIPEDVKLLVPQISTMVAFDFLINNFDRWSGSNVKASPDGKHLYYMDNALAFGIEEQGQVRTRTYLKRSQKFSRSLYIALHHLDASEVTDVMLTDTGPWPFLLSEGEIAAMMKRRDYLVAYMDELIALYGEERVLVFP